MILFQFIMLSVPLLGKSKCIWPVALRPAGLDTFEKELFDDWWTTNRNELANLHCLIAEQWIYRHWDKSNFSFLPLDSLTWETRIASSEEFLCQVNLFFGGPADAEHDYKVFHENQLQTAKAGPTKHGPYRQSHLRHLRGLYSIRFLIQKHDSFCWRVLSVIDT